MPAKNRITVTCAQCGKTVEIPPSQAKRAKNTFCSNACRGVYQRGSASPHWTGGDATLECAQCGKTFQRPRSSAAKYSNCCCSYACQNAFQTTLETIACTQCGKTFDRHPSEIKRSKNNFCSIKCSGAYHREHRSFNTLTCDQCGKTFQRKLDVVHERNFCSRACKGIYDSIHYSGAASHMWQGGPPPGEYYGPDWPAIKSAVRKRDNYTCQRCGKHQNDYRNAFHVHHVIPLRMFSSDQIDQAK